ncbi:MAG TPA: DUF1501 domain-containing protein [Anaerolineales bacterium]|nr:DUF1501 domain-containing protein [Anaerolineales bacterium]
MTRRTFLQSLAAVPLVALPRLQAAWPAWMPRLAFAPPHAGPRGDVLVVVFLRGAADALNMVVPHGEAAYYRHRPTLAVPRPDDRRVAAGLRAVDLDGFFGWHPALRPLLPAWDAGHLAVIHACGGPDESRSHFQAMELMERGLADVRGPASGWIARHLASLDTGNSSPLRAVGLGEMIPHSLRGAVPVTALRSIADFHLGGDLTAAQRMQLTLATLYEGEGEVQALGRETLHILNALADLDPAAYAPQDGAAYPETNYGFGLRQIAGLIKADVGLEAAALDLGGWDTHFAQGSSEGLMASLLAELAQGLAAFHADLANSMDNVILVVMTEFGRRAYENASLGTDHGHAGVMFVLGGNVEGGRVHAEWPGLEPEQLFAPGDLAVTIDYRDVLAEICLRRLNNPSIDEIFPNHTPTLRGLVRDSS